MCNVYFSMKWSFAYILILLAGMWFTHNYFDELNEATGSFMKKRTVTIAEKLQMWNEVKFRESYKLEWSIGMLGSYIELSCVERRPLEKINYSFPPIRESSHSVDKVIFDEENNSCSQKESELSRTTNIRNTKKIDIRKATKSTDDLSTDNCDSNSTDNTSSSDDIQCDKV